VCFFYPSSLKFFVYMQRQYYEREMEKIVIRTNPLGKDRDYNRYWWFRSNGRIFVENSDSEEWGYYTAKEEVSSIHVVHFFV